MIFGYIFQHLPGTQNSENSTQEQKDCSSPVSSVSSSKSLFCPTTAPFNFMGNFTLFASVE
jgi:hypothetical protein